MMPTNPLEKYEQHNEWTTHNKINPNTLTEYFNELFSPPIVLA